MNHRQSKNTYFKSLELFLTRTYEAPFKITLMGIPVFQHLGYLPHILQFKTLLQQESLWPEIIFMSDGNKQSKCFLFCTSAFLSANTASHISYIFPLWMPRRLLFKQGTFLLPPPPPQKKKKKGFHKSGRGRKKIKLKQHNYISFSSILSTRWEGKLQRKPPLLLGVTSGERDAWNSNSGRARDMPVWGTHSFQMGFEQGHMFSVVISNDSAWAVRL